MSLGENQQNSPLPFRDRVFLAAVKTELDIFDVQNAVTADYHKSDAIYSCFGKFNVNVGGIGFMGKLGLAGSTVAFNSTKIPLVTMPTVALEALQYSDNSILAGVAAGAAYGGWTLITTGVADSALSQLPGTKSWLEHRHPTQVEVITGAFPGLETSNDEKASSKRLARVGKFIGTHVVRGMTAIGVGANSFVAAAHLEEQPKPAITHLRRSLAVDGGVIMGLVAGGSAAAINWIGDSNPGRAEQIHDFATDPMKTLGAAVLIMAVQGTKKQWSKQRLKTQTLVEQEQDVQEFAEVE